MASTNRYAAIIEHIFLERYKPTARQVQFTREDIARVAAELDIRLPKNLGDVIYSFRYRSPLPDAVRRTAPPGEEWVITLAGHGRYQFRLTSLANILPRDGLAQTKIPNATPGIITQYALSDEQALLAILRYNRLVDIFSGITCYSLQSHLRTTVKGMGQVETDEVYVGVDKRGAHYVFPVQAKGGSDKLGIVQAMQDWELCREKFSSAICRPISAQFMSGEVIALFEFEQADEGLNLASEKHYRLVHPEEISSEELRAYANRTQP